MEFVDAVRLVYDLANGMEPTDDEASSPERKRQAESQSEALNLICDWLHTHGTAAPVFARMGTADTRASLPTSLL